MRILLIRHGDPDYANDTVTEKGKREAALLADRLAGEGIDKIYCSPLGRAQATARPTAARIGKEIHTLPYLRELDAVYTVEGKTVSPWDIFPHIWTQNPQAHDKAAWADYGIYDGVPILDAVRHVEQALDALLLSHGFRHNGRLFEVLPGYETSTETIALFCHMGLGNVLLAHLAGIATPLWWHQVFLPPTSVTTVYMEQHCTDTAMALAHFVGIGDISHLYAGGEPVSTSGLKNCKSPTFPPEPAV